ncbi:hypothetical protein [Chondrinema litorale]|uniref:hypothetical protein n=1 Tax=Chondrinema litorale TaxID=2994555 RepID=UPI0025437A2F|nr:hypothetical protein [Chondrinema litorale]UZR99347.1 hypothetical protein OQ292_36390 [Chondrinema litorale]
MKPKILQVRGVAVEKTYPSINDDLRNDFISDLILIEELDFCSAYKTNKRGCHYDIFLGEQGTIIFRPFHFVDGLDDFCSFNLEKFSNANKHAMEFYQWSSKRESKIELWLNSQHLVTAAQKKMIRAHGNKSLVRNKDVYETANYYLRQIAGITVEDLTDQHKIYRCVSSFNKSKYLP